MTLGEFVRWIEDESVNLNLRLVINDSGWQNDPQGFHVTRDIYDEEDVVELW